jgi:hypothetical protein
VYRPFQFQKRSQQFVRADDKTPSVVAVRVNNPDRFALQDSTPGKVAIIHDDSALMRLASSCSVRLVLTLKGASKCQNT